MYYLSMGETLIKFSYLILSYLILVGSAIPDTQSGGDSQGCQSLGRHPGTMLDDWSS